MKEEVRLDKDILKTKNNLNDFQQTVALEMEKFDLNKFFRSKGASSAAVILITKNQMIMTDTFVRNKHLPDYGNHYEAVKYIYNAIYGVNSTDFSLKYPNLGFWQDHIMADGNILIQLCEPLAASSLVWIPDNITKRQLEFLENFNNEVKKIVSENSKYFSVISLLFDYKLKNKYKTQINNIDELINKIKYGKQKSYIKTLKGGIKWDSLQNKNKLEEIK